ncbi:MAG: BACON domain-containing protein [Bacteroidales bacterium]|nr:BACON domain-containing protein [Bacteroidales bacterium]
MKKIVYLLLGVLLIALAGCQKKYVDRYDSLAVDRTSLVVTNQAQTIPVMVYYSGAWSASLGESCTWASLDRTSGKDIGAVYVTIQENTNIARVTYLTLSNDKNEQIDIELKQNAGI